MHVVIDANVYASSLIKPEGTTGKMLFALFKRYIKYNIVTSSAIFLELEKILLYPKIRSRIKFTDQEIATWLSSMYLLTEVIETDHLKLPVIVKDDPDDDKYIIAALVSKARYLITGDKHLLKLNPYQDIRIVTTREFLELENIEL